MFLVKVVLMVVLFVEMSVGYLWSAEGGDLGRLVVTPFRYEDLAGKTAADLSVITQQEIQQMNARTLADVMRSQPGLDVRDWYGNGMKTAVDVAGFGEQGALNVLVMLDGRRLNDVDLGGVDWAQIPVERIERIEILRSGSGGVLYGDNASSGVINIVSKRGQGGLQGVVKAGAGSYAALDQSVSVSGGAANRYDYRFDAGRSESNGYRMNSFSRTENFSMNSAVDLTDVFSVSLGAGTHNARYGMPGALWQNHIDQYGRRYARYAEDYTKNGDDYVVIGLKNQSVATGEFLADLSYRRKKTDSFFLSSGNPTLRNSIETFGLTPRHVWQLQLADHDNRLVAGADLYKSFYRSSQNEYTDDQSVQNYTNVTKSSLAGYIQNELALLDPLSFITGVRYETARYAFNYHDYDTTSWGHPYPDQDTKTRPVMRAWNTGLVYEYAPASNIFADMAQSFRFPAVDEFSYQDAAFQQQLDTSLRPQTARTAQLGIRHQFAEGRKASVALFRTNMEDELYYNSNGGPWGFGKNENYDRTTHQGVTSSADIRLAGSLSVYGNYSYTEAEFENGVYNGNSIPLVPRHKAALGLRVLLSRDLNWDIGSSYVGRRYGLNDQANAQGRVNGYMVMDSNILWTLNDWKLSLGVNNLLDKEYAEMAGYAFNSSTLYSDRFYYPSPGRNYRLSVEYRF